MCIIIHKHSRSISRDHSRPPAEDAFRMPIFFQLEFQFESDDRHARGSVEDGKAADCAPALTMLVGDDTSDTTLQHVCPVSGQIDNRTLSKSIGLQTERTFTLAVVNPKEANIRMLVEVKGGSFNVG